MTEKIGYIKNPLTIIAIFAGLAEVGGTIVLPLLQEKTQAVYVWFLMVFPTFLVGVFFLVLYNKHHVLYAPSDYRDDSTFKDVLQKTLPARIVKTLEVEHAAENAAFNAPIEAARQAAPAQLPQFPSLRPETRKALKTLWTYQQSQFPNDTSKRWGFTVPSGSPEYIAFVIGVGELLKLGLATLDPRGFAFLTDSGLDYCLQYQAQIGAETLIYSNFGA